MLPPSSAITVAGSAAPSLKNCGRGGGVRQRVSGRQGVWWHRGAGGGGSGAGQRQGCHGCSVASSSALAPTNLAWHAPAALAAAAGPQARRRRCCRRRRRPPASCPPWCHRCPLLHAHVACDGVRARAQRRDGPAPAWAAHAPASSVRHCTGCLSTALRATLLLFATTRWPAKLLLRKGVKVAACAMVAACRRLALATPPPDHACHNSHNALAGGGGLVVAAACSSPPRPMQRPAPLLLCSFAVAMQQHQQEQ